MYLSSLRIHFCSINIMSLFYSFSHTNSQWQIVAPGVKPWKPLMFICSKIPESKGLPGVSLTKVGKHWSENDICPSISCLGEWLHLSFLATVLNMKVSGSMLMEGALHQGQASAEPGMSCLREGSMACRLPGRVMKRTGTNASKSQLEK